MDLLERYLGAIARQLPDDQKADVTAELRDLLLSQVEEAEAGLGRAQTREEMEALLIRFGHPLTVAGRYRKVQHLIGPEVFPFWWAGVKLALLIVAGLYAVLIAVEIIGGEAATLVGDRAAPSLTAALVFAFGAVTLVCALIERFGKTALLTRWKPRDLPPPEGRTRSRFDIVIEIATGAVFMAWWTGLIHFQNFIPDLGLSIDLAPVWKTWFWPILGYSVFEMGANLLALFRPGRVRTVETLLLVRSLAAAGILAAIFQAGHWLDVSSLTWTPEAQAVAGERFDRSMRIGIGVTILIFLSMAGVSAWRLRGAVRASRPVGTTLAA